MKTFTVITPVYNGEQYIAKCIQAVASCNYDLSKVEHIIVDDGSTDNTKKICEHFAQKYDHIKFFSKTNGNWGSVINYVKHNKLVHNDYVVVCDADDIILSNAFKLVNQKCNNADFVSGTFYLWDGGKKKRKIHSYYFLFKRHMKKKKTMHYYSPLLLPHCSYLKNSIFYKTIDLKEGISFQDNILYLDSFRKSNTITYIPNGMSLYWQKRSGNSMSEINHATGLEKQLNNFKYYSEQNTLEPFFYFLIGVKKARKYLKNNHYQFSFKSHKLNLTGFPIFVRPVLRLMYLIMVRKFVSVNK